MNIRYPIYEGVYRILTLKPVYQVKDGKIVPYEAGAVKTDKTRAKRNGKRNGNYLKL